MLPSPRMSYEWKFLRILHDLSNEFLVWLKENFASMYKSLYMCVTTTEKNVFLSIFLFFFFCGGGRLAWVWQILSKRFSVLLEHLFLRLVRSNRVFLALFCLCLCWLWIASFSSTLAPRIRYVGNRKKILEFSSMSFLKSKNSPSFHFVEYSFVCYFSP